MTHPSILPLASKTTAKAHLFASRAPVDPIQRRTPTYHRDRQPVQRKSATFSAVSSVIFFLVVAGLLVWRRFDFPPQEPVLVVGEQNSTYVVGESLRRGMILETTENEFLALQIGTDIFIALDQKSRIELSRIYTDERIIQFTRGRILVKNTTSNPLLVETHKTESLVSNGLATFVNYDFKQLVTIAPLEGSIQAHVKGAKDYLLLPVPMNVAEIENPILLKTELDTSQGPSAPFYAWAETVFNSEFDQ